MVGNDGEKRGLSILDGDPDEIDSLRLFFNSFFDYNFCIII